MKTYMYAHNYEAMYLNAQCSLSNIFMKLNEETLIVFVASNVLT